jgi:heme/copper-type cytochrome/quinol oxidase subunit 2
MKGSKKIFAVLGVSILVILFLGIFILSAYKVFVAGDTSITWHQGIVSFGSKNALSTFLTFLVIIIVAIYAFFRKYM